jgi:predicted enzyme related to lactoylglutathione lyase
VSQGISQIIFPVADLDKAKAVFGALLGVEPMMDQPYYVGYQIDGQDIGLDPKGHQKGHTGPVGYVQVEDIKARLQALLDAGATLHQDVTDVGGGKLIATVKDADGNVIGITQQPW